MQKIMFSDKFQLTRAVLEGRKTMTRRIIKDENGLYADIRCMKFSHLNEYGNAVMRSSIGFAELVPRYKVGEVVAVAEAYKDVPDLEPQDLVLSKGEYVPACMTQGWANKEFVRADIMPERLRITDVLVERLQEISDEDCLREGILEDCPGVQYSFPTEIGYCGQYPFDTPRDAFATLIDKVSGKGTFESNPWVFVYEFELVK